MWWTIGGIFAALGVILGAFGAHGLESLDVDAHALEVWQTASRYHLFHALALLIVGVHPRQPLAVGILFSAGIALFSGSLYVLALSGISWLGAITPLGGLCWIAGWITLAVWPRAAVAASR